MYININYSDSSFNFWTSTCGKKIGKRIHVTLLLHALNMNLVSILHGGRMVNACELPTKTCNGSVGLGKICV